jgi:hypothetical protein
MLGGMKTPLTRRTVVTTRLVAIAADALQFGVLPLFATLSPLNNVLDVLVGMFMVWRLGWHVAFLPAFVVELIPFVDVFPTWTLATWFVTRGRMEEAPPPPR